MKDILVNKDICRSFGLFNLSFQWVKYNYGSGNRFGYRDGNGTGYEYRDDNGESRIR
jgi:hypothetical protein